jgi:hypothetical protein
MDSSYTVQQPPVAVNCKTPVKWLENQCLTANRGVEYDWMNFLYDINSGANCAAHHAGQPVAGVLDGLLPTRVRKREPLVVGAR